MLLQLSLLVNVPEASMEYLKMVLTHRIKSFCHGELCLYTQRLTVGLFSQSSLCSRLYNRRSEIPSAVFVSSRDLYFGDERFGESSRNVMICCCWCCIFFINKVYDPNSKNIYFLKGLGWNEWCVCMWRGRRGGIYTFFFKLVQISSGRAVRNLMICQQSVDSENKCPVTNGRGKPIYLSIIYECICVYSFNDVFAPMSNQLRQNRGYSRHSQRFICFFKKTMQ